MPFGFLSELAFSFAGIPRRQSRDMVLRLQLFLGAHFCARNSDTRRTPKNSSKKFPRANSKILFFAVGL